MGKDPTETVAITDGGLVVVSITEMLGDLLLILYLLCIPDTQSQGERQSSLMESVCSRGYDSRKIWFPTCGPSSHEDVWVHLPTLTVQTRRQIAGTQQQFFRFFSTDWSFVISSAFVISAISSVRADPQNMATAASDDQESALSPLALDVEAVKLERQGVPHARKFAIGNVKIRPADTTGPTRIRSSPSPGAGSGSSSRLSAFPGRTIPSIASALVNPSPDWMMAPAPRPNQSGSTDAT